jgi:hypothetical protein
LSTLPVSPPQYHIQEENNAYNGYFTAPQHLKVKNEPSSEELFVSAFLRDCGLNFESEVPIYNLMGDTKKYRVADFKLTDLGVYIEYFGQYNATKLKRAEYDKKVDVYIKNNIPTIFIYPHELGFLEYAFHIKMVKLLKLEKFNFSKKLFKYRLNRFKENFLYSSDIGSAFNFSLSVYIFLLVLFIDTGLSSDMEIGLMCGCLGMFFYNVKRIISDIRRYFYKDE